MSKNKKRNKKYVTNAKKAVKSSPVNTWILIAVAVFGGALVIYLS